MFVCVCCRTWTIPSSRRPRPTWRLPSWRRSWPCTRVGTPRAMSVSTSPLGKCFALARAVDLAFVVLARATNVLSCRRLGRRLCCVSTGCGLFVSCHPGLQTICVELARAADYLCHVIPGCRLFASSWPGLRTICVELARATIAILLMEALLLCSPSALASSWPVLWSRSNLDPAPDRKKNLFK